MSNFDDDDAIFDESSFDEDEELETKGKRKMSKLKRADKLKPIETKVARTSQITAACALYVTELGETTTECTALTAASAKLSEDTGKAVAARALAESLTATQNASEEAWDAALEMLCKKLELNTKEDKAKLDKTTIDTYEPGSKPEIGLPAAVVNLRASMGDFPGTIDLQWDALKGARSFVLQVTTTSGDESSWRYLGSSARSFFHATGLTSGTVYYFRVAAVGVAGQGPWSTIENKMAA